MLQQDFETLKLENGDLIWDEFLKRFQCCNMRVCQGEKRYWVPVYLVIPETRLQIQRHKRNEPIICMSRSLELTTTMELGRCLGTRIPLHARNSRHKREVVHSKNSRASQGMNAYHTFETHTKRFGMDSAYQRGLHSKRRKAPKKYDNFLGFCQVHILSCKMTDMGLPRVLFQKTQQVPHGHPGGP